MPTRVLHLHARRVREPGARFAGPALAAALLMSSVACAGDPPAPAESPSAPADREPASVVPEAMQRAALDDAAQRTTIARDALTVINAEPVVWSDGSLGCPQPGMLYTQALVPGYRIVVQAGEQRLEYHASQRGRPIYCPASRVVAPVPDDRT